MTRIAPPRNAAALTQGVFYLATGLWPIVHLPSFERVTGRKKEKWLVKTMGGLIAAVGGALAVGALEKRRSHALSVLGVGSAFALAAADIVYVARGQISRVYLADAAAETALLTLWFARRHDEQQ